MKKLSLLVVALIVTLGFIGCSKYEPVPNMTKLNANFVDSKWNGQMIPSNEVCGRYNSVKAMTPKLLITNLPSNTNKIILSFSDETFTPMSNGGHGIISYEVKEGTTKVEIPSVQSETFDLPKNIKSVKSHASTRNTNGAYLAPCSGGKGNTYSVTIEAIHEFDSKDKKPLLLGESYLRMGKF